MSDTAISATALLTADAPPAAEPPQASADVPASAQPSPQGTASTPASWADALPDELKGFAANKGWADSSDAVKSYQHLEKLLGADKAGRAVLLPKDDKDSEGAEAIYKALGKPEAAADYGLTELFADQPAVPELISGMSEAFLAAGLNKRQAQEIASQYGQVVNTLNEQKAAQNAQELQALKKELGAAYDNTVTDARRGADYISQRAGVPKEALEALEHSLGPSGLIKAFAEVGKMLSEDTFVNSSTGQNSFSMSPSQAQAKLDELRADPIFINRYQSGDQSARLTMEKIHKAIAGEQ
jgi:hypothetical protein